MIKSKEIKMVPIINIVPNPKNANKHPESQIERLVKIINYQGFREPLIISNRSGFVVCGHGRLEVAKKIGMEEVPVIYQDFENEAQEYAHMVADNEIARWAELDEDLVKNELKDLKFDDLDFLGLDDVKFLDEVAVQKIDEEKQDDIPEAPASPITTRGDVWVLGQHRLMCGDSTMIDDVEKLLKGNKVDLLFTDPPYNVAFNGRSGKHEVIKNDNLEEQDFSNFINDVIQIIQIINPPNYYIWCNWNFYGILQDKLDYKACIVWAKNVFGLGKNYRHQHEFCLFNGSIDEEIKNESDLWEIAKDTNYMHPTQKPTALSERALGNHKNAQNILDLFGGSGSTLIGCEKLNRKAFLMELDEKYCDVIIKRWETLTGKAAILESNGKAYKDLVEERNKANG